VDFVFAINVQALQFRTLDVVGDYDAILLIDGALSGAVHLVLNSAVKWLVSS
jgi:hypothetical protein